jgi:Concanavalin A-like lectin/glucanases superfamily/Domain of unknown function (DUF1929)/Bacterial Ig domain
VNQTTTSGTAVGPISFTVGDVETAVGSLTVSGSSNNTTLVPNVNIVFGGSGANRTVTVTPAANQNGTATITVTVSDGQLSTPTSFQLTVNAANTPPTISAIAAQTINEDTATGAIGFTVGDAETAVGSLTVSGSSNNTTLVPNGNIAFGGSGANRTVTVTPASNQNGTTTITVTVNDGQLSTPTSFQLTVNAVNDAPTITAIVNQTTTSGTAVGPISFTVGDVETAVGSLTVSGSSNNTTLVPNANIVFGGSGANRTVTVTPAGGQNGTATITVTVSDGQLSTPTSFQLTVNATNTAPTITPMAAQVTNEDTATGAIGFTVGDAETAVGSLTVSGSSNNTTLVPNANIVFGGSGANRTVTVTPAANQNGIANITVTVSDGQLSTPTSFQLTVNAVNDAPTITAIVNQTTTSGTAVGPISFTVGDVETAVGSLTVSGSSNNTTLVPNANIVFGGSGANRTVTVTPAANQTGVATITVTVSDGQLSTPASFQLTVNATFAGLVAAYGFNEISGTTVTDVSGFNNTGTLGGGVTRTTSGKFGSALVFNGSSFVTIPSTASLSLTSAMTLEAWVNPLTVSSTWRDVIYKGNDNYYLSATSTSTGKPAGGGTFGATTVETYGTVALPVNTWTHLAVTYDGATLRLYVNGVQVSSLARTGNLVTSTNPLQIGGDSLFGQFFQGMIDDVRVYNVALTAAQIQSDMNTAVGGAPPPPDTTPPTVAVIAPPANSTVVSTVTVAASATDNVDVVGVQFFLDGAPLGSEVPFSPFSVSWDTTTAVPGSHTLTAVARDAGGNSSTSAPVPVTVRTTTVADIGLWSAPSAWPLVAVHANLLPTGDVLAWDGANQGGAAFIWRPSTNSFTSKNPPDNIFCAGHCLLPDGRLLVVGGHIAAFVGIPDANIFDPVAARWTQVRSMAYGRWYPTAITIPDGRVLVVAGDDGCQDNCVAAIPEIYEPATNTWVQIPGAANPLPEFPHLFVLPDGRVLATGSFEEAIPTEVLDISTQTWSVVDPAVIDGHSSVMYSLNKFMKSGTAGTGDPPYGPAAASTYVLDMTQAQPAWRQTAPMAFSRSYHNLTILPDGSVLATGGNQTTDTFDQTQAVFPAELWSPTTESWTTMSSLAVPRFYHSIALLLPDGRVLIAGGGRFGGTAVDDMLNAEIYSPPYLFKGTLPAITTAPNLVSYNSNFSVATPDATRIATVSLLPLGSVTHHFNANQRYLSLSFQTNVSGLDIQAPANANIAPPGYYMLFIVDTNGVPSVAATLKIQ